ncbi:hypothetical protein HQ587_05450 [bacterium]|nr:hypothetical protein [bacterium]
MKVPVRKSLILLIALICGCTLSPEEAMQKGLDLYNDGKITKSYQYLMKAHAGGIQDPELFLRTAYCMVAIEDDPSAAIKILSLSVQLFPEYAPTYDLLGVIAQQFGPVQEGKNLQQAIYYARKAVELEPDEWKFKDNLGGYYYLIGKPDSALFWFKAASELNPTDEDILRRIRQVEVSLERE